MKKSKLLLAISLAFVMFFASFSTAFATDYVSGTETSPIKAAVSKILEMPIGTALPAATFKYTIAPKSVDGNTDTASLATMPALGVNNQVSITLPAGATEITDTTDPNYHPGNVTYYLESQDIFANLTPASFPHAGEYIYTITEVQSSDLDGLRNVEVTYSPAEYTLTLLVADRTTTGPGTYIAMLSTQITTVDNPGQAGGEKIDPTPGSTNSSGHGYSEMVFTNTYVHTNNGGDDPSDPDNPDPGNQQTLVVSKTVTGSLGDKSKYFSFDMTVTAPALQTGATLPDTYLGYVVDSTSNQIVTDLTNNAAAALIGTDNAGNSCIMFTRGANTTFKLKDGQKLVIINAAVGSPYNVTEAASDHAPSLIVTTAGTPVTVQSAGSATANSSLNSTNQLVGEPTNLAAFTNNRDIVTPTGLSMNDLPFAGMIVLALCALAAFIVVSSRKRRIYSH